MIPGPEFRFAVVYFLLLRAGAFIWLRGSQGRTYIAPDLPGRAGRLFRFLNASSYVLMVGPLLGFLAAPLAMADGQLNVVSILPWLAVVPAGLALLLVVWSGARSDSDAALPYREGPYRHIRYPIASADALFFLSLGLLTANSIAILTAAGGVVLLRCGMLPLEESARRRAWGQPYLEIVQRTGVFRPPLKNIIGRQYTVPKRFGMAAIVALLTVFALLFGILKYFDAPPIIYLFVASEITAICLVQIFFGEAPRFGSVFIGALLLPFWVSLTFGNGPSYMPHEVVFSLYVFMFLFGGLLGYCIGALAAGFFLLMDALETAVLDDTAGPVEAALVHSAEGSLPHLQTGRKPVRQGATSP
jgi:protein-S-isoprenylcysteine O-methyltransferase Ste14